MTSARKLLTGASKTLFLRWASQLGHCMRFFQATPPYLKEKAMDPLKIERRHLPSQKGLALTGCRPSVCAYGTAKAKTSLSKLQCVTLQTNLNRMKSLRFHDPKESTL